MKLLQALIIAFSMYSKLPMPHVEWSKDNMRYALCFFPLVGAACGGALYLWAALAGALGVGVFLRAAVAALLPIFITGGIHLDGFCDTVDGLSSHQAAARKLEILADSHCGAFAVIGCGAYLLLSVALWTELPFTTVSLLVLGIGYVLSRCLSGLSVVALRPAKASGMLAAFSDGAQKNKVRVVLAGGAVLCAGAMLLLSPVLGGACVAAALAVFVYYRIMSYRQFGGITGDLAGYFLTLCELAMLAAAVLVKRWAL